MALHALPPVRRSPAGRGIARARELASRLKTPVALKNLASMPLTVTGLGFVDWGIFTQTVTGGLIFAGLALVGLEYLIADPE